MAHSDRGADRSCMSAPASWGRQVVEAEAEAEAEGEGGGHAWEVGAHVAAGEDVPQARAASPLAPRGRTTGEQRWGGAPSTPAAPAASPSSSSEAGKERLLRRRQIGGAATAAARSISGRTGPVAGATQGASGSSACKATPTPAAAASTATPTPAAASELRRAGRAVGSGGPVGERSPSGSGTRGVAGAPTARRIALSEDGVPSSPVRRVAPASALLRRATATPRAKLVASVGPRDQVV